MIEDIERLGPEFYVNPLGKVRPLNQRHIVVRLERTAEDIAANVAEGGEAGTTRIRAGYNLVLIIDAPTGGNKSVQVNEVVEPADDAAARQDRTASDGRTAAINELSVLQRERVKVAIRKGVPDWKVLTPLSSQPSTSLRGQLPSHLLKGMA